MVERLARFEPISSAPFSATGLTITLGPPMQRWSLRARDPSVLATLLGTAVPERIGETLGPIACLGPDEWLWRSGDRVPPALGGGLPVSIVDVSERSIGLVLDGTSARAALNSGCPLDLERFAVGRTSRTVYDGVEIILHRDAETRWTVDVWRSFSEWLWLSLTGATKHERTVPSA